MSDSNTGSRTLDNTPAESDIGVSNERTTSEVDIEGQTQGQTQTQTQTQTQEDTSQTTNPGAVAVAPGSVASARSRTSNLKSKRAASRAFMTTESTVSSTGSVIGDYNENENENNGHPSNPEDRTNQESSNIKKKAGQSNIAVGMVDETAQNSIPPEVAVDKSHEASKLRTMDEVERAEKIRVEEPVNSREEASTVEGTKELPSGVAVGNLVPSEPSSHGQSIDRDDGLVSAQVIDEGELEAIYQAKILDNAATAEVVDANEFKEKGRTWKIALSFVCIIAIVLAIVIPLTRDDDDDDAPTQAPTVQTEFDYLYDLFVPFSGAAALNDESTPQFQAMDWLLNEDPAQLPIKETNTSVLLERYAAVVFYHSTGGENWIEQANFLTNSSICEWQNEEESSGLACFEDRNQVRRLRMGENNLNGTIPRELIMFDVVTSINIRSGHLYGTLPSTLGDMLQLTFLQIVSNQLTGTIPPSMRQVKIQTLALADNQLSGTVPPDMFLDNDSLEVLHLGENRFEGPLPELNQQSRISFALLYENMFTGTIPQSHMAQNGMQFYYIYDNELTGTIPEQIRAMQNLLSCDVSLNMFTGSIPSTFGSISTLADLHVMGNEINGTIPNQLGRSSSLQSLLLSQNKLSGTLPMELSDLANLVTLDAASNSLTGSVPMEYTEMTSLVTLDISDNLLSEGLEESFCALPILPTSIRADCLGDTNSSGIPCSCCTSCCGEDTDQCNVNLLGTCETRSAEFQSDPDRGTTCECVDGGTEMQCTDICESCNLDRSICARSVNYGFSFDSGTGDAFYYENTLQYTVGRSDSILFRSEEGDTSCEVFYDGQQCQFCGPISCANSEFMGYVVECSNLGGPSLNTCSPELTQDAEYLEVFKMTDLSLLSGCEPAIRGVF